MNREETLNKIVLTLSFMNERGLKEYGAWFTYYFGKSPSEVVNLQDEDVRRCYKVAKHFATDLLNRRKTNE
jgi:hypothetical protein